MYRWTKGDVFELRKKYLSKVKKPEDLEVVWKSVWMSDMNEFRAKEFFEIFSERIDKMVKKFEK